MRPIPTFAAKEYGHREVISETSPRIVASLMIAGIAMGVVRRSSAAQAVVKELSLTEVSSLPGARVVVQKLADFPASPPANF